VCFALLALPSADVAVLLRAGTLRVSARLGALSLEDLSQPSVADPAFKKLLAIEGGDLADFSYETFDPSDNETFPGYNSSIHLRAGSFKFTFMEQPIRDLLTWATKFAKMKAVYDAASQAAVQRASGVTRMHYDVVVKTPIIVLPRDGLVSPDRLVLRLGEIVGKNEYLGDAEDTCITNAGLSGINVSSEIETNAMRSSLQMINDVAITAKITEVGGQTHRDNLDRADQEASIAASWKDEC
jgi:vacuolar protein sorting-associated protein 13A/C